jgi:outer membrane protein assembly factor BamB
VSIADGRAFTMGWDGEQDTVYCLDAATGRQIWKQSYPCQTILQWPGPRATPTVHGGSVYTLGQHGQLRAWDAKTGNSLWQRDLPEEYQPDADYGCAWSPLVVGDVLILSAGSHGLAIRTRGGSVAWGDDRKKGACVSAVRFEHDGRQGVLVVSQSPDRAAASLVGVDPRTGRELWRLDGWGERWGAMGVDPIVHEGQVFVTSAEQYRQAARFTIAGGTLRQDWTTNRVAGYTGGAVLLKGYLYLVDGSGILKCVAWESGDVKWQQRGFDERGTLIAAGDVLLIQTGSAGDLVVAAADPTGYRELRRSRVFNSQGHTFTAPVLAGSRIYCRSYAGELTCLDLTR